MFIEQHVLRRKAGVVARQKSLYQGGNESPASASRTGRRSMETFSPTQIIVFLNPEHEEHARYLLSESFPSTALTLVDTREEQVTWGTVFTLTHKEKRLTLALAAPVTPGQIEEIAYLVKIRLVLGFVVRGAIDLRERIINSLA